MSHSFERLCWTVIAFKILCSPALAAERAPPVPHLPHAPMCKPLDKMKSDLDAKLGKTHFVTMTPGQFHFAEGLYAGSPSTPEGLPPGDGAILVTHDGDDGAMIVWTSGKNACAPIQVNGKFVDMLRTLSTGPGEVLNDDASEERKL